MAFLAKALRRVLDRHSWSVIEKFFGHALTLTVIALMLRYERWLSDTLGLKGWQVLGFEAIASVFLIVSVWECLSLRATLKKGD
jgi:hypothetical protein